MTLDWMDRAACKGLPSRVFFLDDDEQPDYATARHVCSGCPVRSECLGYALELNIRHGMFAGLTPTQRERLRRQRRSEVA